MLEKDKIAYLLYTPWSASTQRGCGVRVRRAHGGEAEPEQCVAIPQQLGGAVRTERAAGVQSVREWAMSICEVLSGAVGVGVRCEERDGVYCDKAV